MKQDISGALLGYWGKIFDRESSQPEEFLNHQDDGFTRMFEDLDAFYQRIERLQEHCHHVIDGMDRIERAVGVES